MMTMTMMLTIMFTMPRTLTMTTMMMTTMTTRMRMLTMTTMMKMTRMTMIMTTMRMMVLMTMMMMIKMLELILDRIRIETSRVPAAVFLFPDAKYDVDLNRLNLTRDVFSPILV